MNYISSWSYFVLLMSVSIFSYNYLPYVFIRCDMPVKIFYPFLIWFIFFLMTWKSFWCIPHINALLVLCCLSQLGCHKQNSKDWLKKQKIISYSSVGWKTDKGTGKVGFLWEHSSWLLFHCELTWQRERDRDLVSLLIRALIPSWGPHPRDHISPWLPPKGPPLQHRIAEGFQHMNLGRREGHNSFNSVGTSSLLLIFSFWLWCFFTNSSKLAHKIVFIGQSLL